MGYTKIQVYIKVIFENITFKYQDFPNFPKSQCAVVSAIRTMCMRLDQLIDSGLRQKQTTYIFIQILIDPDRFSPMELVTKAQTTAQRYLTCFNLSTSCCVHVLTPPFRVKIWLRKYVFGPLKVRKYTNKLEKVIF